MGTSATTTQPERKSASTTFLQPSTLFYRFAPSTREAFVCCCMHLRVSHVSHECCTSICAINFTRICTKNCAWICIHECTRICAACGGGGLRPRSSKGAQAPHL